MSATAAIVSPLVVIADAANFTSVQEITHDSDFVQVTVRDVFGNSRTYARRIRQRSGLLIAWEYAALMARQVEEVASLVSTPALVAWLIDAGFTLNH